MGRTESDDKNYSRDDCTPLVLWCTCLSFTCFLENDTEVDYHELLISLEPGMWFRKLTCFGIVKIVAMEKTQIPVPQVANTAAGSQLSLWDLPQIADS